MYRRIIPRQVSIVRKLFCSLSNSFRNAGKYIELYNNLAKKISDQSQEIKQLEKKVESLKSLSTITLSDRIKHSLLNSIGKTYESKNIRQQNQKIQNYRLNLEEVIAASQKKWQQPRRVIIQTREKVISNFVADLIPLEEQLHKMINVTTDASLKQASELSHRILINTMAKEQASYFLPQNGHSLNEDEHEAVSGQGKKIDKVLRKGWKIKGKIIKKAQVTLKK